MVISNSIGEDRSKYADDSAAAKLEQLAQKFGIVTITAHSGLDAPKAVRLIEAVAPYLENRPVRRDPLKPELRMPSAPEVAGHEIS